MQRLDTLARDHGYYFHQQSADRVIHFVETFCRQSKGDFAGKPLSLLPWQRDFITRLYGWRRPDGTRRYRQAAVFIPKKNGKTTLASALCLYHLIADGERGAEVYTVANDHQQASICFDESANMVTQSPLLSKRLEVIKSTKRIVYRETMSVYRALSSSKSTKHGYNVSALLIDEISFMKDRELFDVLRYSTAFRRQPLIISISTAGYDREGIGFEQYSYCKSILEGKVNDLHFLPVVYEASPDSDWTSLETARACNPSIGVTIPEDDFREAIGEAKSEPRKEANYRALRLNQWVGHSNAWLSTQDWQACGQAFDPKMLEGRDCWCGVDLARKHDLAAYALVFRVEELYYLLVRYFMPRDCARRKEESDHVPYGLWARQGYVTLTDGDVIDYAVIRRAIKEDARKYNILSIGFDPFQAEMLCNQQLRLEDGFNVVEVRQGILSMGPPSSFFERLLKEKRIRHGGNPVLAWNAQNVVVREDANQNIMPDKRNSTSRIDGITASIIALSRAMVAEDSFDPRLTIF